jgi:hypothetical protein
MMEKHEKDYKAEAWKNYSFHELAWWVHLMTIRAEHRSNPDKRAKDLYDARNYLSMMDAKLKELESQNG